MTLYIDSAILNEATHAAKTGWISGITTNPTLLAKSDFSPADTLRKLSELNVKEIFYQVRSNDSQAMVIESEKARELLGEKLVIKIPPTNQGFQFAAKISGEFSTCITAVFTPAQALVAREIETNYVAVYVNRATRLKGDGTGLVNTIANVLKGSSTEIIAASLKSNDEAVAAFVAGAHHLTLPYNIFTSLIDDPHSKQAVEQFNLSQTHL